MPWQEVSTMTLRKEFVMLALQEGSNFAALCRHFQISRDKGYKWIGAALPKAASTAWGTIA